MLTSRVSRVPFAAILVFGLIVFAVLFWFHGTGEDRTSTVSTGKPGKLRQTEVHPAATFIHYISKESGASCLDGSPPAYYLRHGSGSGKNKWIVMFEGGGWCYDSEQCYLRSKTILGSSKLYPTVLSEDDMKFYISHAPGINPYMHNWNTVLVRYCDGSSFAGNAEIVHKGSTIHFKGAINRDETIRSLFELPTTSHYRAVVDGVSSEVTVNATNMTTAEEVVIAGCSAGALGVLLGVDQMADIVRTTAARHGNHGVAVRALVDSGYFMEYTSDYRGTETHFAYGKDEAVTATTKRVGGNSNINYPAAMRDVFHFANISAGANPACLAHHRGSSAASSSTPPTSIALRRRRYLSMDNATEFAPESACIFAANLVPHIRTPMFLLQPQYDQWQVLHIYSQAYTAMGVNAYGRALVASLTDTLFHAAHPGHGVFLDSCSHHCTSCSDHSENSWSGPRVTATLEGAQWLNSSSPSPAASSALVGLVTGNARVNEAQAFHLWYENSLRAVVETASAPPQPGVNWFFQNRTYPCADCCKCSVDMLAQLQRSHNNFLHQT